MANEALNERIDSDPDIRPQYHTYVESKAEWDDLPDDGLPRYPEGKPGER